MEAHHNPQQARGNRSIEVEVDHAGLVFEYDDGPFEISPGLARVLLRVMRKAAERRGIDLNDIDGREHLAS